jgi:hypothetical protein
MLDRPCQCRQTDKLSPGGHRLCRRVLLDRFTANAMSFAGIAVGSGR